MQTAIDALPAACGGNVPNDEGYIGWSTKNECERCLSAIKPVTKEWLFCVSANSLKRPEIIIFRSLSDALLELRVGVVEPPLLLTRLVCKCCPMVMFLLCF